MPNTKDPLPYHPPSTGVDRACEIAKSFFNHCRGFHDTDADTVRAIARRSHLTVAEIRQLLQPSRRPKDVRLGVWGRLLGAYRRHLERELAALNAEIIRLEALDPDERAVAALLDKAKALVSEIEAAAPPLHPGSE